MRGSATTADRMRLIHTADWHLGHTLHGVSRDHEHEAFLGWLLDRIAEHAADALVIAGDVFDGQNPPISALALFHRFVAQARRRFPALQTVVVAGNHDSASRLDASAPLLEALGVHVVGALPIGPDGALDAGRLVVPLVDRAGRVALRCAAVPYLRPADLPPVGEADGVDPLIEGVRRVYAAAAGALATGPGEAALLTGHCHMTGGALSELSERKILGGNLHALPVDIFCESAAYVALGHLHRAQAVGGLEHVRYSGSPIPLALDEAPYRHQVMALEFAEGRLVAQQALTVPRAVAILRTPAAGPDALIAALRGLPLDDALPRERWPFLEAAALLPEPRPGLREEVEAALAGRPVRLLKLSVQLTGTGSALADAVPQIDLADLKPDEVFRRLYQRQHDGEPDDALLAAFHELVEGAA